MNLARYIERGMDKNKIYRTLYYGFHEMSEENMREYVGYAERVKDRNYACVRHIIIAPERAMDEEEMHNKILELMDRWIRATENYGVRYAWGMHYNTGHPHAHIAIVASYPEDIVMEREDLREFKRIAEEIFEEKIGIEKDKKMQEEIEKELEEAEMEIE